LSIFWKLGWVIELLRSSDGKARATLVNVANDRGSGTGPGDPAYARPKFWFL